MPEKKIKEIADNADMIVRGYAFTKEGDWIRVFNINDGFSAMLINKDGAMLETNMNEIEQALVLKIWKNDSKYMEAEDAQIL